MTPSDKSNSVTVRLAGKESLGAIKDFLRPCQGKPFGWYPQFGDDPLVDYLIDCMNSSLSAPDSILAVVSRNGATAATGIVLPLGWDSAQFGFKAGRIDHIFSAEDDETADALLSALCGEAARMGIRHLSVRVDSSQLRMVQRLEKRGFEIMDAILNFSKPVPRRSFSRVQSGEILVRLCEPGDVEEMKAVARRSFVDDRFHNDPVLPGKTSDEVHASWVENSTKGFADVMLVAEFKGKPVGFMTSNLTRKAKDYFGKTIGTLVLMAVSDEARGHGVARLLTDSAIDWLSQEADIVEVGTQMKNMRASRLYVSDGFNLVSTSFSLRKWSG